MRRITVLTVVGTRPEIIRLSSVIHKLDSTDVINHILVHTGQNFDFELNDIFFRDLNLRNPDYFLDAAKGTPIETIGNILMKIDSLIEKVSPDAFLVLGDTNSCLASIAAKRRHIPIFHMEAGNRCFDQRVPEEMNRRIVDSIADINLPYSSIAREYLLKEGFPPDRVIKTGSPMYEVLMSKKTEIENSDILQRLGVESGNYFLVSAHREENINSSNFNKLVDTLNSVAELYQLPIVVSTHPRTRKMIDLKKVVFHPLIKILKPLGFIDYNKLQIASKCVLSDSGTISEESSILKFKALNIREAHERPEAMEEAAVMMTGLSKERILQALDYLVSEKNKTIPDIKDYMVKDVSEKILKIIISYIDYVKRLVYFNVDDQQK